MVPYAAYRWFLTSSILMGLGVCAVLVMALRLYQQSVIERLSTSKVHETFTPVVEAHLHDFFQMSVLMLLLLVVSTTLLASYLFHRVAGPIYRIRQHLDLLLNDSSRSESRQAALALRNRDQLQDIADRLNELQDRLERPMPPELATAADRLAQPEGAH